MAELAQNTPNGTHAGLEAALRDAAARAMKAELTILVVLGFYQSVSGLARCLGQYRKVMGMPRGLSPDLVALLDAVCTSACRRVTEPNLTEDQMQRLYRAITRLGRAVVQANPVPAKAKTAVDTPKEMRPTLPEQPIATAPVTVRRRPNDYDNIGAIAIRAMDAAANCTPVYDAALRQFLAEKSKLFKSSSRL